MSRSAREEAVPPSPRRARRCGGRVRPRHADPVPGDVRHHPVRPVLQRLAQHPAGRPRRGPPRSRRQLRQPRVPAPAPTTWPSWRARPDSGSTPSPGRPTSRCRRASWAKGQPLTVCALVKTETPGLLPMPDNGWIFSRTQMSIEKTTTVPSPLTRTRPRPCRPALRRGPRGADRGRGRTGRAGRRRRHGGDRRRRALRDRRPRRRPRPRPRHQAPVAERRGRRRARRRQQALRPRTATCSSRPRSPRPRATRSPTSASP